MTEAPASLEIVPGLASPGCPTRFTFVDGASIFRKPGMTGLLRWDAERIRDVMCCTDYLYYAEIGAAWHNIAILFPDHTADQVQRSPSFDHGWNLWAPRTADGYSLVSTILAFGELPSALRIFGEPMYRPHLTVSIYTREYFALSGGLHRGMRRLVQTRLGIPHYGGNQGLTWDAIAEMLAEGAPLFRLPTPPVTQAAEIEQVYLLEGAREASHGISIRAFRLLHAFDEGPTLFAPAPYPS